MGQHFLILPLVVWSVLRNTDGNISDRRNWVIYLFVWNTVPTGDDKSLSIHVVLRGRSRKFAWPSNVAWAQQTARSGSELEWPTPLVSILSLVWRAGNDQACEPRWRQRKWQGSCLTASKLSGCTMAVTIRSALGKCAHCLFCCGDQCYAICTLYKINLIDDDMMLWCTIMKSDVLCNIMWFRSNYCERTYFVVNVYQFMIGTELMLWYTVLQCYFWSYHVIHVSVLTDTLV